MADIYALYGRQAEMLESLRDYFRVTQQGLKDIRDGKILPRQLVVSNEGWEVKPAPPEPENGKLKLVEGSTYAGADTRASENR